MPEFKFEADDVGAIIADLKSISSATFKRVPTTGFPTNPFAPDGLPMSALVQKRTNALRRNVRYVPTSDNAPQQSASLFDHLIGAGEQLWRYGDAKCLGGLEVDHELELSRLFNRPIMASHL